MFSGLFILISVPILVAQWIGVVAIGKARRSGQWWCMLVGTILLSLGLVAGPLISIVGAGSQIVYLIMGQGLVSSFGSLLFLVGFALHAMGFRRVCERVAELEMVIEAQNEQLGRQS
jgi:hypothetical protein